ncbi:type II secretion system F family protein [Gordonia sp. FQ]|uniref:type II secretion system F family protein n=1 Tax=Gordonia sp. FQ TaxID=3446634 RepID=UPI003F834C22
MTAPGLAVAVLLCAAALLAWPSGRPVHRLHALSGGPGSRRWTVPRRPLVFAAVPVAGALAGIGPAIASGIVVALWFSRSRRAASAAARAVRDDDLMRALTVVSAELSVGAPMVRACRAAAAEVASADSGVAAELARVAGHVELGGEPDAVAGADDAELRRLGEAWATSVRHGVPMAALTDAMRRDLSERKDFGARTQASLAGPRATATVLAVLPVLGLGLGELMGAHPVGVLLGTPLGSILLVVGVGLAAAGLLWVDGIVAKVLR